jgi:hypothetical protein
LKIPFIIWKGLIQYPLIESSKVISTTEIKFNNVIHRSSKTPYIPYNFKAGYEGLNLDSSSQNTLHTDTHCTGNAQIKLLE